MKTTISLLTTLVFFLISCSQPEEKKAIDAVDPIKANDEILNNGNLNYADQIFADNYRDKGPTIIKEYANDMRNAFPDLKVSVENKVIDANTVAWVRHHTGTHSKPFRGFMPSGDKLEWESVIIAKLNDEGKVTEEWGASDIFQKLSEHSLNGTYQYLPPLEGYCVVNGKNFIWTTSNIETGVKLSEYGKMNQNGKETEFTIEYSNLPDRVGSTFTTRMKEPSGDTINWEFLNENKEVTGNGKALKVKN
ncbi:ester cyclase [Marinigracilibium pacificum]|uniref:Ester cyclase n=1 Tax=Marinigracilibium pacificum TaxID=2729599 RepID=A0A848J2P1_9BACT|nr:ester cyclase [Marinigracilibium pacificum]NMM47442.1 ester cyclase [Marinigracilibium pacificum]